MSDNVDSYFEALGSTPLNPIGFVVYAVLFVLGTAYVFGPMLAAIGYAEARAFNRPEWKRGLARAFGWLWFMGGQFAPPLLVLAAWEAMS